MNRVSLATQIKKVIGGRIVVCSFLLMLVIVSLSIYDVFSSATQIKGRLNEAIKPLEDFTISQVMINNVHAVYFKLEVLNQSQKEYHIAWRPYGVSNDYNHLRWSPPFSWAYDYQLGNIGGYQFGYFEVQGSFLSNKELVYTVFIGAIFVLFSLLTMVFLLYPLSTTIPEKLFVKPINRFLELVSHPETKQELSTSLPAELEELEAKIFQLLDQAKERERNQSLIQLGEIAAQVAHDIRSPLAALNTCLKVLPYIPEDQRILMRNAASRINDIANNLLQQYKNQATEVSMSIWLLAPLIEGIISEKRIALKTRHIQIEAEITSDGFSAFAAFDANEMKRLLSNLINNSLEAFPEEGPGLVVLFLDAKPDYIDCRVIDNGGGIPAEHLVHVLSPGVSLKQTGSGLGLSHAKKTLEEWQGTLVLESTVRKGTTVFLRLPRVQAPRWFVSEIIVYDTLPIGILDDDQSVHDAWDQRLSVVSKSLQIHHFTQPEAFIAWYRAASVPVQVFSDYELLGHTLTGLDVLEDLDIQKQAILVTSHYEMAEVLARCQRRNIKLLPKNLLAHVAIRLAKPTHYDCILLDDNHDLRMLWEMKASLEGKKIATFASVEALEKVRMSIDFTVPIYIDSDLGNSLKGEVYAKILFEAGYQELYLATGHDAASFARLPWIKAITGKEPPF